MKQFIKDFTAPAYLGFAIAAFTNNTFMNWQFWAIIIPFFALVKLTDYNKENNS